MTEYDLYIPLHYNDGHPIEVDKLSHLKRLLVDQFGGLTHFPQENEGVWRLGQFIFRDRIVIFRVLSDDSSKAETLLSQLKQEVKREWNQKDVLIIARNVRAI